MTINLTENLTNTKKILLSASFIIQSSSYLYTILRNPGIPPMKRFHTNPYAMEGIKRFRYCRLCKVMMNLDKKTHHCHLCCICVEGIQ